MIEFSKQNRDRSVVWSIPDLILEIVWNLKLGSWCFVRSLVFEFADLNERGGKAIQHRLSVFPEPTETERACGTHLDTG